LEETNKGGRPNKEWMDNITEWCGASIQELYHTALEKQKWRRITRTASGTYGHWSLGWWWWFVMQAKPVTLESKMWMIIVRN